MGLFRFLFKWSLQITGASIVGYYYCLKPEQQASLYGGYRSFINSYRTAKQIYEATNEYKSLLDLRQNPQQFQKQLNEVNINTAKRLQSLSRINKGVYMRLGQYMGHMKYAFPQQFEETLKSLNQHPNYQPQDYKYLKPHIESQLGKKTKQIFQTLNTTPIHSSLFHQVYKGELLQNFLDINLKVIYPYAKSQAKYDFWFMKKAIEYINNFKQKNFPQTQSLYLNLLYNNLRQNVQKELNFKLQQQNALTIKQKFNELQTEQRAKSNTRVLPVYIPHIYSQYTQEKILIIESFQGHNFSNVDAITKENFNIRNISSDVVSIWNSLLERNQLILQSYTPFNIMIRKSRANEQGQYQISPMNFLNLSTIPSFFTETYSLLWRQMISSKKLNPKNPQQRITSINKFYNILPQVYFNQVLNNQTALNELKQKANIEHLSQQQLNQMINLSKNDLPKDIVKKLEQKKVIPSIKSKLTSNSQVKRKYQTFRKIFQIEYQPWKIQTLFKTYRQIFRQQKHFGAL